MPKRNISKRRPRRKNGRNSGGTAMLQPFLSETGPWTLPVTAVKNTVYLSYSQILQPELGPTRTVRLVRCSITVEPNDPTGEGAGGLAFQLLEFDPMSTPTNLITIPITRSTYLNQTSRTLLSGAFRNQNFTNVTSVNPAVGIEYICPTWLALFNIYLTVTTHWMIARDIITKPGGAAMEFLTISSDIPLHQMSMQATPSPFTPILLNKRR